MPIIVVWQDWHSAGKYLNGDLQLQTAYLGLGSNSEDAGEKLTLAQERIEALPDCIIEKVSARYVTEPQGFADQPWFSNMVMALSVGPSWTAWSLLQQLLRIELELGRVRNPANRFGPRTIDIDLLLFGKESSGNPDCTLPHPRMQLRAFVLVPLMDIAPDLRIKGTSVRTMLSGIRYRLEGNVIYQ